jgi:hypothetical protein
MSAHRLVSVAIVVSFSLMLTACFDITQRLSIGRNGAGQYQVALTANGLLGEALKNNRGPAVLKHNAVKTRVIAKDGNVTQVAIIDFKSLSDLRLSDESVSLTNHRASWFGLGPSHITFRRTLLVDRARRENVPKSADEDRFGNELAQTMFGNHVYVFSVTVPGSVDRATPIRIGHSVFNPQIGGGTLDRTVTWRIPLYTLLQAKLLTFEIDFSAYGSFSDAQSLPEG